MTFLLGLVLSAGPAHPELGRVSWLRDFEAARAESRRTGRPMLVLFDEVPGCSTVQGFGAEVLSNQAMVARIERDFVPVAIFNNVGGVDRAVLEQFGEPTWNNPVVRVMTAELEPLAPRFAGPYTLEAFAKVLGSVRVAKVEPRTLLVSAPCFWECEAQLGQLPAVVASRVGFLEGEEVVEVEFDGRLASRETMITEAARRACATHVFARTAEEFTQAKKLVGDRAVLTTEAFRVSEKDTKYYLKRSARAGDSLSALEQVRVNAALRFGADPEKARASCGGK